jgi:hypothetical protein
VVKSAWMRDGCRPAVRVALPLAVVKSFGA